MNNQERLDECIDVLMKKDVITDTEAVIATMLMNIAESLAVIADVIEEQPGAKDEQEESEEE